MTETLADRMKSYESSTKQFLPRRTYTIIRLDGKAFHTFTKGFNKPFDAGITNAMTYAMHRVSQESGATLAYTQSDEISLLLTDFNELTTQPWLGGNVQKIASITASIVSSTFNYVIAHKYLAYFDARVFSISDPLDVASYFIWRQRDGIRNSVQALGKEVFGHKALHKKSVKDVIEMLDDNGTPWSDLDPSNMYGTLQTKGESRYRVEFKMSDDSILLRNIPQFTPITLEQV